MGTKNNPGKFDCYANAAPDEPMFILLARDANAPRLVRMWAADRQVMHGGQNDPDKVKEAFDLADAMDAYREKLEEGKNGKS